MGKNILFAVTGLMPTIVTQMMWACRANHHISFDQIVIVTTGAGKRLMEKGDKKRGLEPLLGKGGKLDQYYGEYGIPPKKPDVRVMSNPNGEELDDVVLPEHFEIAGYTILDNLRGIHFSPDDKIHCIFAGGRRVMVSYLMSALTLVGKSNHRLYYLNFSPGEVSRIPNLWFLPKGAVNISLPGGEQVSSWSITIKAIEIPYPRLGDKYSGVVSTEKSYKGILDRIQNLIASEVKPVILNQPSSSHGSKILGNNLKWRKALKDVEKLAGSRVTPILLNGESGTGKEIVAKHYYDCFHPNGKKSDFVTINCMGFSADLIESELFGHRKGAFTGAIADKIGVLESANNGVAFLDEIGKTSLAFQAKLLRFIQFGEITPVGGTIRKVNVQLVFALSEDPLKLVEEHRMLEDFYFRVSNAYVSIPPLRERKDDIPLLADHFVRIACSTQDKPVAVLSEELLDLLAGYAWPGNIRELEKSIETAIALSDDTSLQDTFRAHMAINSGLNTRIRYVEGLPHRKRLDDALGAETHHLPFDQRMAIFQERYILAVVNEHNGNVTAAGLELGLNRTTLQSRLRKIRQKPSG